MIRTLFYRFLSGTLSRREFVSALSGLGVGAMAAGQMAFLARPAAAQEKLLALTGATGGQITCETLRLWGIRYVFGNTGAYEAGFLDALVDYPDIQYVLGLHEGAVVAMADGYARTTGRTAFVNVHSITGTANALGLIVNAWADSSPIVITVGFSASTDENRGVFTETTDLETVPRLYTKHSFHAGRIEILGESLRNALRLASILPTGPVYLGVSEDVWSGKISSTSLFPAERTLTRTKIPADFAVLQQAADWLAAAENPLLVSGAELSWWGGIQELVRIADLLGATVIGDTAASRSSQGFPGDHPRYLGVMRGPLRAETPFDVVLLAGTSRLSMERGGHPLIPLDAKIIEVGIREDHLARVYPADLLIYAHPEAALQGLYKALRERRLSPAKVRDRRSRGEEMKKQRQLALEDELRRVWNSSPLAPERLAAELNRVLDAHAIVVTEGVSSDEPITNHIKFDPAGGGRRHLVSSGGSLGWGLGAGVGAKLGAPDRQVVVLLGDGSYQFGIHALWTARRMQLPLIVVIFNNRAYQANRWALAKLKGQSAKTGRYIGINLTDPEIDHVAIARGYGLEGERVDTPNQLAPALQRAIDAEKSGQAYVLDVIVDRRGGGADADWHELLSENSIMRSPEPY